MANVLGSLKATVLALAPHTVEAASRALSARGISEPAQLFVPVFPVDVADKAAAGEHEGRGFVLQGLFEPQRRAAPSAPGRLIFAHRDLLSGHGAGQAACNPI